MSGSNVTPRINHNLIESPTLNAHLSSESESLHAACEQMSLSDGSSAAPCFGSKTAKVHTTYGGVAVSDSLSSLRDE